MEEKRLEVQKKLNPTNLQVRKEENVAASLSISASTLAKTLSGIDLPQSKENIRKYVSKNIAKMNKDVQSEISKIFETS